MSVGTDANGNLDYKLMLALRKVERLSSSKKQALLEGLAELDDGFLQERQRKIDFAVDLGYPQQKVEAALRSLGPDATVDQLLKRLASGLSGPYAAHERTKPPLNEERESTASAQAPVKDSSQLRPIVVDGSNVAMKHGNGRVFSCKGIWLVVEYFRNRGMSDKDITVFVPQWRKEPSKPESPITDQDILFRLEREGVVVFTPSKKMQGRRIVCYDDRFIVKRAADTGGVIVSNDAFRDLLSENEEWRETIEKRVLMFCFANDVFMVPQDPLGRYGPSLEDMLRFSNKSSPVKASASEKRGGQVTCPYGERCTFGSKCRFYHPERGDSSNKTRSRSTTPTPLHVRTGSSTEDLYASQKDTDQLTDKMRALQFQSSPQPTDIYTQKPSDYRCYSDSNVSHIPERPHPSQRHPYTFPLAQLPKHHSRPNDTSDKSSNNLYPEKIENSPYLSRDVPDTQCYEVPSLRHDTYPQAVPHPQYSMHQDVRTCVPQAYLPNPRPNYMQQCHSPVQSYQSPAAMGHQSYQYHHQPMLHSSSPSPHHAGGGREAFVPCPVQNYRQYDRPQSKRQYDETQFRGLH